MDDLDDFMSEIETKKIVQLPDQFEDVVDIVVNEQREKADAVGHAMDKGDNEQLQLALQELKEEGEESNPFWTRFL